MSAARTQARVDDDGRLGEVIAGGASALQLALSTAQIGSLVEYVRLLERWNATYNLTAIRDPLEMATQHIVDCLAVINPMRPRLGAGRQRVLDVGSGAGLPGLVIAVVLPEVEVTCVDTVGKKTAFIAHAGASLGLTNLGVRQSRVQDLRDAIGFSLIASRAFASLPAFVDATRAIMAPGGWWMAMKGKPPVDELANLPTNVRFHVEQLHVPALDADRCIVWGTASSDSKVSVSFASGRAPV